MIIYGLKSLTDNAYQLVQDSYNKTAECAKSIFETLSSAFSSTRSIRIYSVVILTWTISLGLPVAEAASNLLLTNECCGPRFFGNVLLSTCRFFHKNFKNSENHLNLNTHTNPYVYEVNCKNCFISAQDFVTWNSDIKRMGWKQGADGNGTVRLTFYPSIPTVNVQTNCTLPFSKVTLHETSNKFLAIITEFPK